MVKSYIDCTILLRKILGEISSDEKLTKKKKAIMKKMERPLEGIEKELRDCESQKGDKIGLTYIEGALINALAKGYIILFDNFNCAKPESTELFNPLLEANPTLNIFQQDHGAHFP